MKTGIKIVIPRKLKAYKKPTFTDAIAISKTQRQVNKNVIWYKENASILFIDINFCKDYHQLVNISKSKFTNLNIF